MGVAMAKPKLSFIWQACDAVYTRWQGKCDACGEWNTIVEETSSGGIGGGPQRELNLSSWRRRA